MPTNPFTSCKAFSSSKDSLTKAWSKAKDMLET